MFFDVLVMILGVFFGFNEIIFFVIVVIVKVFWYVLCFLIVDWMEKLIFDYENVIGFIFKIFMIIKG